MSDETISQYQARRRAELATNPSSKAKPIPTKGEGTKGNTAHLYIKPKEEK